MPLFSFGRGSGRNLFSMIGSGVSGVANVLNRGADAVSSASGNVGDILGKLSGVAKNPLIQSVAGSLGVGGALDKFASATQAGQNLAQRVGGVAGQVRDFSSPATYFNQPAIPAVKNALERAKGIAGSITNLIGSNPASYTPMPRAFAM
jgi:hypothetical protein